MTPPLVSVIIVSRGRPDALTLCLKSLEQQFLERFEVVIVADPAGLDAVQLGGWGDRIKAIPFDEPNISVARNLGIAAAAGDVVTFIDDDAVAEPTWLSFLTEPFSNTDAAASGGYVRGRNGISFQWRAERIDRQGWSHKLELNDDRLHLLEANERWAIKTQGTNMAFRRDVLAELGGFDPAFHFYLDETDLNRRLADRKLRTAIVPDAQVHHSYAASAYRDSDRSPRSLREVGSSLSVFLRKHAPVETHDKAYDNMRADQRRRLLRFMVAGGLEPRDVGRLLDDLDGGFEAGKTRPIAGLEAIPSPGEPYRQFNHSVPNKSVTHAGWLWGINHLERKAFRDRSAGFITTVFALSPTYRRHWVRFSDDGLWLHRGGLWGRADRDRPAPKTTGLSARVRREIARVAHQRGLVFR